MKPWKWPLANQILAGLVIGAVLGLLVEQSVTDPEALQAKTNFESKCVACHAIAGGEGKKIGPDLLGVTQRRDEQWLQRFLKSPEQMLGSDATAKALLDKYKVPMPNQNLSDAEIRGYIKYFRYNDSAAPKPQAKK